MKLPNGSGPSSIVSFRRMSPRKVVPDTTVPTPWDINTTQVMCEVRTAVKYIWSWSYVTVRVPAQSTCRLSGTQRAGHLCRRSWRRAGWGTSWAGPCSLRSHWRSERWDTSCRDTTHAKITKEHFYSYSESCWNGLSTSLNWSLKLWLWRRPCSVPGQGSSYSRGTSVTSGAASMSLLGAKTIGITAHQHIVQLWEINSLLKYLRILT